MSSIGKPHTPRNYRVELTDQVRRRYGAEVFDQPVAALAKRSGLAYMLVYNIVKGRVKSVSNRHFKRLFGEDPPYQDANRVEGNYFRHMVDLWIFLNDRCTKLDLYKEFYADQLLKMVDYRIFTGQIHTVEPALERKMENKFLDNGLDRPTLARWLAELEEMPKGGRVPYEQIRPLLLFLKEHIGVHPNSVLHQQFDRYETGRLKSVSPQVYAKASKLKNKAQIALASGRKLEIDRLREEIYGTKSGYTLFTEVERELRFLKTVARKSPKRYLGRSIGTYAQGKCKRVATWRAEKIHRDCAEFVAARPTIPVKLLPPKLRAERIAPLLAILVFRATDMLFQKEGAALEKQILTPAYTRNEYTKKIYGFTQFDRASIILGMKKKAFDLMVATNCDIFRQVGKYAHRWYLSDLYLKELSQKASFGLISAKYELMAKKMDRAAHITACMN